jgi:non-reducing end alpha-L-arabinofuranosidase
MKRLMVVIPVVMSLAAVIKMSAGPQQVLSAGTGPCDIYASGGTACVAAHSTVRALFSAYSGRLYQVRRASNGGTTDIGTLTAGGYANANAQDQFCAGTTCTITILYDQTSRHNDLTVEGAGGAGAADQASVANALPITVGGHPVYGVYIAGGNGYRDNATNGIATGGSAEGMYMVASGTHVNTGCCFDYGNAETNTLDNGNGHMDAVNLGTTGPWVGADLENGIYGWNSGTAVQSSAFVTAMLKNNGQTTFAVKGGNAQSGGLNTQYNGTLPTGGGYIPMHLEGAIVMGTGGDNSRWSVGSFFEGAMTAGYPSDATENSVQASVVAAGYAGNSNGGATGTITGPSTKCVDVAGDDLGVAGTAVQLWDCQAFAVDQHWTYNYADNSLRTLGRCLDINGNGTTNGTQVELWDCNGVGGQKWMPRADGSLFNPQSGRCLDSPGGATADGTRLQIYDCNSTAAQKFTYWAPGVVFYQDINYGGAASAPIAKGDYPALPAGVPNDWMSSLRVPAGWTVQAYADGGFGGAVCTYTADTSWVGAGCNDAMSSFKIH